MTQMNNIMPICEVVYVVVNYGVGSKVLRSAKEYGFNGGTILLGRGTANSSILRFLSLYDERKEIVVLATDLKTAENGLELLNEKFKFEKPNHGIVFSTKAMSIYGVTCFKNLDNEVNERGVDKKMYQVIMTIVEKGKAEDVVEFASKAGSKGGTIINARGSGSHETSKLFNIEIEPEKEMVMILAKVDSADKIITAIREGLEIDKPGNGVIFVQDIVRTYGIHD